MTLIAHLDAITNAPTLEALWDMHCEKMAGYAFDRLIYGVTRYRTATSLGDPLDMVLLTNHDPLYVDVFMGEQQYRHAPMVRWALENEGACSWGWLAEMATQGGLSDRELKMLDYNRRMEVVAGYTVSFKSVSARTKGAIALCARRGSP